MNTIATTTKQPRGVKNFNLRAMLAGSAASASLIVAGVIVFGSLAAYVAFNALPIGDGGGEAEAERIAVQVDATADAGAPASAAATLADAAGVLTRARGFRGRSLLPVMKGAPGRSAVVSRSAGEESRYGVR
ncbi:MAG: hypothetical protein ABWY79_02230, partial [Solirubrobacterales bacterium]